MRGIDFSSWQSLAMTLLGLALFVLIGVGIRLLVMMTIQQRRERANRQINERLKLLIAAYKTLGGSFTGNLAVDPRHLRDVLHKDMSQEDQTSETELLPERSRRIRDAVEAALSDILLLGTEEHVKLAERAVCDLVAGKPVHTHELVISLRNFIREVLDLAPIPSNVQALRQGPTRPVSSGNRNNKANANKDDRMKASAGSATGGTGMSFGGSSSENSDASL